MRSRVWSLRPMGVELLANEGWVLTVALSFTDSAGVHWVREQNGRLGVAPTLLQAMRARTAL